MIGKESFDVYHLLRQYRRMLLLTDNTLFGYQDDEESRHIRNPSGSRGGLRDRGHAIGPTRSWLARSAVECCTRNCSHCHKLGGVVTKRSSGSHRVICGWTPSTHGLHRSRAHFMAEAKPCRGDRYHDNRSCACLGMGTLCTHSSVCVSTNMRLPNQQMLGTATPPEICGG